MEYIFTFFTQSAAFKFEKFLKEMSLQVSLMPVPRQISSSCGIAARTYLDGDIDGYIIEEVDSIYEMPNLNIVYKSE